MHRECLVERIAMALDLRARSSVPFVIEGRGIEIDDELLTALINAVLLPYVQTCMWYHMGIYVLRVLRMCLLSIV